MRRSATTVAFLATIAAISAAPATAQLSYLPVYAIPVGGDAATWLAASYGRGLNAASGELDAFAGAVGRNNGNVAFSGGVGFASMGGETELSLAGNVAVPIGTMGSSALTVQGGLGWMSVDVLTTSITTLNIPIGVAIRGQVDSGEAVISPWAMPRLQISRASSSGSSNTSADFGASGGVAFNFEGGFGVHTALDVVVADGAEPITFGFGGHYTLGSM